MLFRSKPRGRSLTSEAVDVGFAVCGVACLDVSAVSAQPELVTVTATIVATAVLAVAMQRRAVITQEGTPVAHEGSRCIRADCARPRGLRPGFPRSRRSRAAPTPGGPPGEPRASVRRAIRYPHSRDS